MSHLPATRIAPAGADSPKPRILAVDDEEVILEGLRVTLGLAGHRLVITTNPLEALEWVRRETFSVILTDQMMPQLTGLEFLAEARTIQPDATRLLFTGIRDLDTVIEAINHGEIYRFLLKPWLSEELLITVNNAVQRFELIRQNAALQAETAAMNQQLQQLNQSLAEQLARVAQQSGQLAEQNQALEQNLRRSVELCLQTMQTFYPALGGRAHRVSALCAAMADELELAPEKRQMLEISAWLHGIGLLGLPRELIRRWEQAPLSLSETERALVQQHPVIGQELAGFVHHLAEVGTTIRAHQERFDGKGYPDQLAGENIPWPARLLAVAVAYVTGAENHPDRPATAEFLVQGSGSAFDPEAVEIFFRALPQVLAPRQRRVMEVKWSELQPGMVLARGVYSANGMLLFPDGKTLTGPYIEKLRNHHLLTPFNPSLLVYG